MSGVDCKINLVGFGYCECGGPDCSHDDPRHAFAYTCGLYQHHGLCELHARAYSDGGFFPARELAHALNLLARLYINGEAGPGQTVEWSLGPGENGEDDGDVLSFRFGLPVPTEELEAFDAHPEANVLPVTWTIRIPEAIER